MAFAGLRADDLATALRGLAAFAATRLAAAFFATFADFLDVLPAIVFTPGRPDLNGGACLAFYRDDALVATAPSCRRRLLQRLVRWAI